MIPFSVFLQVFHVEQKEYIPNFAYSILFLGSTYHYTSANRSCRMEQVKSE